MVESKYSSLIDGLVDKIGKVLLADAVDVIDTKNNELYECISWELATPREDGCTKIGSANFSIANNMVMSALSKTQEGLNSQTAKIVFSTILTILEARLLIRRSPLQRRKEFRVVRE